jgi:hypothetical protein
MQITTLTTLVAAASTQQTVQISPPTYPFYYVVTDTSADATSAMAGTPLIAPANQALTVILPPYQALFAQSQSGNSSNPIPVNIQWEVVANVGFLSPITTIPSNNNISYGAMATGLSGVWAGDTETTVSILANQANTWNLAYNNSANASSVQLAFDPGFTPIYFAISTASTSSAATSAITSVSSGFDFSDTNGVYSGSNELTSPYFVVASTTITAPATTSASGQNVINVTSVIGIDIGQSVANGTSTGIPANSVVTGVGTTSFTINNNLTANVTSGQTFLIQTIAYTLVDPLLPVQPNTLYQSTAGQSNSVVVPSGYYLWIQPINNNAVTVELLTVTSTAVNNNVKIASLTATAVSIPVSVAVTGVTASAGATVITLPNGVTGLSVGQLLTNGLSGTPTTGIVTSTPTFIEYINSNGASSTITINNPLSANITSGQTFTAVNTVTNNSTTLSEILVTTSATFLVFWVIRAASIIPKLNTSAGATLATGDTLAIGYVTGSPTFVSNVLIP